MASRLDRLFILLESGSSAVTRRAAAKQIGEVQKLHPHELHNLLNRLLTYLHSSSWDSRIAAAHAVESILLNVPKWEPKPVEIKSEKSIDSDDSTESDQTRLCFLNFDLEKVLENGARLMGSEGTEFDFQEDADEDNKERLIKQRALLNEKLGLSKVNNSLGLNFDELVTLDDMKVEQNISKRLMPVQDILNLNNFNTNNSSSHSLSCREKNRAKRKARQLNVQQPQTPTTPTPTSSITPPGLLRRSNSSTPEDYNDKKRIKLELNRCESVYNLNTETAIPDGTGNWIDAYDWPLEIFCSKLYIDLFSAKWEIRHGAATALRELLKSHSDGAGKSIAMTKDEMELNHQLWIEDAVLRLLCVLALDRFGDFVSDQVVAPVRETCAQVLGTILNQMPQNKVEKTIQVLLQLIKQKDWEVRHGGLLGIKYLLVVRNDLMHTFLPLIINDILAGLFDPVDDVGAVAAATLIPVAPWLPKLLSPTEVSNIVKMLWDLLLDQDELTSACNSFMGLLAAILCLPDASNLIQMEPMSKLVPRLWPFLCHSTSSVRKSTLQTLKTLTQTASPIVPLEAPINDGNNPLKYNFGVRDWPTELLQEALRHVYQRVLVEHIEDIQNIAVEVWNNLVVNAQLSALLHAACPYVATWLCLAMQPARLAFDPASLVYSKSPQNKVKSRGSESDGSMSILCQKMYLGGIETTPMDIREKNVTKARCKASQMLGLLSSYLVLPDPGIVYTPEIESPINRYTVVLIGYLSSRSALQRLISSMVIAHWALYDNSIKPGPIALQDKLRQCQLEYIYYDEVAVSFTSLVQKSWDFLATLKQHNIPITQFDNCKVLTLDQIQLLSTTLTENLKTIYSLKPKISEIIDDRRKNLQNSFGITSHDQNSLNINVQAALAGASVCLNSLPEKLNPIIKPIMESLKQEECDVLQQLSAKYLTYLLEQTRMRNPCPNNKIVTNLCRLLKSDSEFTPKVFFSDIPAKQADVQNTTNTNPYHGIITLMIRQKITESQNCSSSRGPGRPPVMDLIDDCDDIDDPLRKQNQIQRIGATYAITEICRHFGPELRLKLPIVWELMTDHIEKNFSKEKILQLENVVISQEETNDLITSLQLIEIAVPHIDKYLEEDLLTLLPKLCLFLCHPLKTIRHLTSRCLATFSSIKTSKVMDMVIEIVIPLLSAIENVVKRQGAAEVIACIVNKLQYKIVPYVVLLVVPLLGRMSDPNEAVRLMATQSFATLIQLMPLDGNTPDLLELSPELRSRKEKDQKFLDYLFLPKSIPDFKIPIKINAELRSYQQAGINWLWFLNKYNLHGILCDDMGLGKTLQTICILAGDHYQRSVEKMKALPSLVVCPPTLTGHWVYEVNKFLPNKIMSPLRYVGLPVDRELLRHKIGNYNLVIASYDIIRKDIDYFETINWNYCVLDEGHVIKNGKTKSSKAIKRIVANHRLILSGTPIQNNVLELWSLFDFLMPGFLGTEKQFISRFSRPILASRDAKCSPKEQEAGALAMEGLHRKVLPFLLRRVKEDVLTDLPPKITQDLLCELSPIQERLYEDLSKKQSTDIRNCIENIDGQNVNKKTHVFQALRYLQNVCNHPKLVLNAHHPEFRSIQVELAKMNSSLDDIEHSGKLPALKQLLLDCGIGVDDVSVNQHRALIFCQLKAMLDIVEYDLLKKHLPAVSYLRLDGSVPPTSRQDIVNKFNGDPSIDVLLLTTQVGGLGLNLTGADTVIFVEHDWNPMKDLQAMDRAHRIGQKKVVNVYRLITRKSLEEKIMGLQKFKLFTANTIVTDENASMDTMGTEQLFDLFNLNENPKERGGGQISASVEGNGSGKGSSTMKNVLENLPELWEDRQYEEEYDLNQFLDKLK